MNTGIDAIKGHMINEFEERPKETINRIPSQMKANTYSRL